MAKNRAKAAGKVADAATESARMRVLRIDGSQNGATLRTRVVRDKTKYNRNLKHKKSLADAGDFPFRFVTRPFFSWSVRYRLLFWSVRRQSEGALPSVQNACPILPQNLQVPT